MFSFQQNKLRQIYDKCYIKTQILRYVSACSVGRKTYCTKYTLRCPMQCVWFGWQAQTKRCVDTTRFSVCLLARLGWLWSNAAHQRSLSVNVFAGTKSSSSWPSTNGGIFHPEEGCWQPLVTDQGKLTLICGRQLKGGWLAPPLSTWVRALCRQASPSPRWRELGETCLSGLPANPGIPFTTISEAFPVGFRD